MLSNYKIIRNKIIMKTRGRLCETPEDILESRLFNELLHRAVSELKEKKSILLNIFGNTSPAETDIALLLRVLSQLTRNTSSEVARLLPEASHFFSDIPLLGNFVEYIYNYWRGYERYVIADSEGDNLDKRPYRTFNDTVCELAEIVRKTYRDIEENITGAHPRVYRQVEAGAEFAAISLPKHIPLPGDLYGKLRSVHVIRQILMNPPLILEPTMNKRTGEFMKIDVNPLSVININPDEWLCYPAKVGKLLIHAFFHEKFFELGFTLCNLFELADDSDLMEKPDAVFLFGVPGDELDGLSEYPTLFFDDNENNILIGACPNRDEFGYFGYLKKMVLTLHNAAVMKRGIMPFHGALVKMHFKTGNDATILLMGDTGAGKSETLEALRSIGSDTISDIIIIADDMGSLEIDSRGNIIGYGTEIGAFLRIDDLKPGYAFGQIDRSIIMSAGMVNARIVLPVAGYETVIRGFPIDYVLYANNYEEIDENHPHVERFSSAETACSVFREGTVMSKGTTTTTGLVHSYFANVFGPPQYRDIHENIATKYFESFFKNNLFVGQMRTRLGIAGFEMNGPEEAARELLRVIAG
ncbi:MAG: phosphoenolpyruvate carboxykinase [Spirochaetae bacterium HGW-Spirochaetae-1]|jgi:energy-coupling factor transporter ATP-binding protein EcfA2|nr:MAG: phosphoenolpyruvate carboxykinase [Spirochaetae bacterium HGW-Spirochaetae-1]